MDRRRFGLGIAAALTVGPCAGAQDVAWEKRAADAADEDSYAIWSLLIPTLRPGPKGYLVPARTYWPGMVNGLVLKPDLEKTAIERAQFFGSGMTWIDVPDQAQPQFAEAAATFKRLRDRPVTIERRLTMARDYRVLDEAGMEEYRRISPPLCVADSSHPWHLDRGLERRYKGFSPPCFFSRVYFDLSRSLGLVLAEDAQSGWKIYAFRKVGGQWQLEDWKAQVRTYNC